MPSDDVTIFLVRDTLIEAIRIASPILAAGVVIGLIISIVQSVTSIQDQTLTFVPKILVMVSVAAILLPWIVQRMVEFAGELFRLM
ncbi:MAG: flagellar biosynthetic protein FliQ [Planctomycetes bacterium]|nr:flagellar biosynthetic protein FliQ [Planctomycetota bacterium]MCH7961858.1 flagellar biosynthetic protein FliQ [Planctomycetota bacterium]MCH8270975.1 flagellar biosynthetic protein FliQ [Planctomycetota bacterium]